MEPSVLIIGSPRCATSWMYRVLKEHPQVQVPIGKKETNFFYTNSVMKTMGIDGYHNLFTPNEQEAQTVKVAVESCPQYVKLDSGMIERLNRLYPDLRIILSIREPISRTWSYCSHLRKTQLKSDQIFKDEAELNRLLPSILRFIERSRVWHCNEYPSIINRWQPIFKDRFHLIVFDDLKTDETAFLNNFTDRVGVDRAASPDQEMRRSSTPDNVSMPDLFGYYLARQSIETTRKLNAMLDGRVSHWVEKAESFLAKETPQFKRTYQLNHHLWSAPERIGYKIYNTFRKADRRRAMDKILAQQGKA